MKNVEKRRIVNEFLDNPVLMLGLVYTKRIADAINLRHGLTLSASFVGDVRQERGDRILKEQAAKQQAHVDTETMHTHFDPEEEKRQSQPVQPDLFPDDTEKVGPRIAEGTHKAEVVGESVDEPVDEPVEESTMDSGTDLAVLASGWVRSQDNGESQPVNFDQTWKRAGYTLRENAVRAFKLAMRNFRLVEGIDFTSLKTESQIGRPGQTFIMTVGAAKRFMAAAQTPEGFGCIDILITEEEKYAELKARIARGEHVAPANVTVGNAILQIGHALVGIETKLDDFDARLKKVEDRPVTIEAVGPEPEPDYSDSNVDYERLYRWHEVPQHFSLVWEYLRENGLNEDRSGLYGKRIAEKARYHEVQPIKVSSARYENNLNAWPKAFLKSIHDAVFFDDAKAG